MGWLKSHADDLLDEWAEFGGDSQNARAHLQTAAGHIRGEYWDDAADEIVRCTDDWSRATKHATGAPPWGYGCCYLLRDILYWLEDNWPTAPDEYELTAIKICEAWAKDGFHNRALTIAFIDRQRQLIWDEPFSVAWAARPES